MIKRKINSPLKLTLRLLSRLRFIITGLIIIIALFCISGYAWGVLKKSDYFKVKDIVVNQGKEGFDFSYLVGYNILNIDLKSQSRQILESYPSYSNIRLIRVLPNRLFVSLTKRKALAYVKLHRYFYVDNDSVLLDVSQGTSESELPVIVGLERKISAVKAGKQYNIKELALALDIIREIKANSLLGSYKVHEVDVTNPVNASTLLMPGELLSQPAKEVSKISSGLEVRMGQDNIRDKISILGSLFIQLKADLINIKYIDLRFKEPVIKFKDK